MLDLYQVLIESVQPLMKAKGVYHPDQIWSHCLSDPVLYQRYQALMQRRPYAWLNLIFWKMQQTDFPYQDWHFFWLDVVLTLAFFRGALMILASQRELTDDDLVWVVQAFFRMCQSRTFKESMVAFIHQYAMQSDMATEQGFSLVGLLVIKAEHKGGKVIAGTVEKSLNYHAPPYYSSLLS